ncbi:hypothetical protein PM082_013681 [Marasmius tenuissimus]|nr:hypothetical protein PM082_013681 [Marasmius tenuissimus]
MSESTQQAVDELLTTLGAREVVGFPIATLTATYFFYGLYMVLVILCVPLLMRDRFENRRFYVSSTLLLFVICTIMVIDVTIFYTHEACVVYDFAKTRDWRPYVDYLMHNKLKLALYAGVNGIPPLANIIAETMLIHRCYIIWGRRKRVAIPLIILSAISSLLFLVASVLGVTGYGNMGSKRGAKLMTNAGPFHFVGLLMSAVVNVLVTLLTAGRIWWINRQSQAHVGVSEKKNTHKLSTANRIILESGMIYPTVMVVYIITGWQYHAKQLRPVELIPVTVLSAGIAPTLALLRAQMTKLSERASSKVEFERVSEIRFNSARLARLGGTSTVTHTISLDIRASNTGDSVLKPPEPLVHPHQSNGLPSSPTRETRDIEKGSF